MSEAVFRPECFVRTQFFPFNPKAVAENIASDGACRMGGRCGNDASFQTAPSTLQGLAQILFRLYLL
jgi:hypothetical protein